MIAIAWISASAGAVVMDEIPPWFHMNRAKHNVIVSTGE
jgi:hypothetical protein